MNTSIAPETKQPSLEFRPSFIPPPKPSRRKSSTDCNGTPVHIVDVKGGLSLAESSSIESRIDNFAVQDLEDPECGKNKK
jgi:hypothetical protein